MVKAVKDFAEEVMVAMQKTDKANADCWTACQIDFHGIQPSFMWGSHGDMPDSPGSITVHNKEVSDAGPLTQPLKPKREPGIR